jgi:hypothetical protein
MNECEWHACGDPKRLLEHLADVPDERRLRLFAVACRRRVRDLRTDEAADRVLELAERYADGLASEAEVRTARMSSHLAVTTQLFEMCR